MKNSLPELLQHLAAISVSLLPGAFGAAVAVAVQQGLTWLQRFVQLAVGIVVSYYAGAAVVELFDAGDGMRNAIGFVAGIAAFETAKALRTSFSEVAKTAPKQVWDWWLTRWDTWFPPKK